MEALTSKLQYLQFASEKVEKLEEKLEKSFLGLMDDKTNIRQWKYYTGFEYSFLEIIFTEIEPNITCTSTTILSAFNQFLLTMVKLRLNLHFKDLGYRFKISATTASSYFQNIIDILYEKFKPLIIRPDESSRKKKYSRMF